MTDNFNQEEEDGVYYAKGSYDNEVEYHNEIICYTDGSEAFMQEVIQRLQNGNAQIDEVFQEWKQFLEEARTSTKELGTYNADDILQNATFSFIDRAENLAVQLEAIVKEYISAVLPGDQANEKMAIIFKAYEDNMLQLRSQLMTFLEKNGDTEEDFLQEQFTNNDYTGLDKVEFDESNPLLIPIHGISLEDYSAASANIANGISEADVAKALGVEQPQWEEASALWIKRMQQDEDFTIAGLFGQYFASAATHPKFINLQSTFKTNEENFERLKTDELYYHELSGAMRAAYEYGMDGAQWLRDEHGISLGDFQSVTMTWANSPNFPNLISSHQEEMFKKYSAQFSKDQGGNIADDIEF